MDPTSVQWWIIHHMHTGSAERKWEKTLVIVNTYIFMYIVRMHKYVHICTWSPPCITCQLCSGIIIHFVHGIYSYCTHPVGIWVFLLVMSIVVVLIVVVVVVKRKTNTRKTLHYNNINIVAMKWGADDVHNYIIYTDADGCKRQIAVYLENEDVQGILQHSIQWNKWKADERPKSL